MQNFFEDFAYNKVTVGADTMKMLKKEDIDFLKILGIQHFNYQKQKLLGNKKWVLGQLPTRKVAP